MASQSRARSACAAEARLCVAGKERLYEYCAAQGVAHRKLGKLIVATRDDEVPALQTILERASRAGVDDLEWLDAAQVASLEPSVRAVRGLFSPSTGIIDSHDLMSHLRRDAENCGAHVSLATPLRRGRVTHDGFELEIGGVEPATLRCRTLVNAAGLWAQKVSSAIDGIPSSSIPGQYFAKGHYFMLSGTWGSRLRSPSPTSR